MNFSRLSNANKNQSTESPKTFITTPKRKENQGMMKPSSAASPKSTATGSGTLPIFPGLPFSASMFPPFVDMSSTQALIALVVFKLIFLNVIND